MMPEDLDRELTNVLRVEPSGEFRARLRSRVSAEEMKSSWRLRLPVTVCAGIASLLIAGGWWLESSTSALLIPPDRQVLDGAVTRPGVTRPASQVEAQTALTTELPTAPTVLTPHARGTIRPGAALAVSAPVATPAAGRQEVLIADAERAGVRLLFDAVAAGRLELPEDMLQNLSLPIVEARTGLSDFDSPWVDSHQGDAQ